MSHAKEIRAANLRELLIQHWQHYRHIETERYWFMSVYAVVVGSILTLALKVNNAVAIIESDQIWVMSFLIVFTLIGLLINIRWTQTLGLLGEQIKEIAGKLDGMLDVKEKVKFEAPNNGIWQILRTRYLFPSFYVIVFIGLVILLVTRLISS